ncbi:translation initiation factor IF-3 [Candidatus Roizmanbacteria bacterium RIFCSPLOWO2_02_FULL_37_19]|uniref:Translation initiation factor IF-3 n=1 Tax=Candidatus Roizmanbacteria bacterium RIFCSPHIGHO2_02_FULL_37_24 TaxID=1802037 RepID=A0A1F7GVW2_9BACT|nr:MAG: translation initiation factor IF-3 [Candidatus Roizmanbacteria bacterium RIFCSPHIGHO2_01_FULL_38_41]OGK22904.1 MAG: translation initiation factor IF-3 [Candidatus Roizmanbacteria bacterium RIFCSPHIGHO2_02_FULL_37_24]OGK33642.1 MAG: translation initiation factor IF-3 [Candidatus Roizmanbacteria bacterium RIFCSPHIGHO2_12_FULL_37_23]OGK44990.1 MAG: translation initiation factor IF-3 [Candidatus Roizmanbacteria bacterium RIFCSPLOWO2_01_FULL_37_57]OGK55294.1 MAG: translation initiation facto
MERKFRSQKTRVSYITNERIRGDEFRVIDADGKQVGVLPRDKAFTYARERGVDLVLVAPGITPPVVKAIDVHKHQYQEEKKLREGKKGIKKSQMKDLQISLFISENDLGRFEKRAQEFIQDGHQVRLKLPLFGRELGKRDMAFELMNRFIQSLENVQTASEPRFQGKVLIAVISRRK